MYKTAGNGRITLKTADIKKVIFLCSIFIFGQCHAAEK